MSKKNNKKTGAKGEEFAVGHLKEKGYEILERNWGNKWGELDIICLDDTLEGEQVLVFVEVKTKVGEDFGLPEEMVGWRKLEQVRRTSLYFDIEFDGVRRIDVIAIVLNRKGEVERLEHYEGVG